MTPKTILLTALASAVLVACATGNPDMGGDAGAAMPDAAVLPFQADTPAIYVAKVKNILVGLPPTDAEVKAVIADPKALGPLIDGWMALPQYQEKMMVFFELAFQQTQITSADFIDMVPKTGIGLGAGIPLLVQNIRESFARTALALTASKRPLTETFTTKQLMMTPALMELYAFLDTYHVDNASTITDELAVPNKGVKITIGAAKGPIPIAETLDPKSPNFMHWYNPDVPNLVYPDPSCTMDPVIMSYSSYALHYLLFGSVYSHKGPSSPCASRGGTAAGIQLTNADFNTWKMVTIRPPKGGETTTLFYDLPTLRSATELVIHTPHPGFFTTPAFFANWPTNQSNQMRVTINQALIVATGMAVDGNDLTVPNSTPGLDAVHAGPGTLCFTCHRTLDPSRSILSSTYSWFYYPQTDPTLAAQKGLFAFQGLIAPITTIDDLATALAAHPAMPAAWAQKLCYYANSAPCAADDPEFLRIVALFKSSNYSWSTLVRELLSSPITTNTSQTKTTAINGEVIAVTRRDHLCAALNNRLGLIDTCGLDVVSKKVAQMVVPEVAAGLPSDGYGRGAPIPVLPNQPTLFYRAGVENICSSVASTVIDTAANPNMPNARHWSSAQPDAAIADFVSTIMALTASDSRAAPAQALLTGHFQAAVKTGVAASDALKSTFIVACLAPSVIGIGM